MDRAQFIARSLVSDAIQDEMTHRGEVMLTATLAVFLENRIANELRPRIEEDGVRYHAYDA